MKPLLKSYCITFQHCLISQARFIRPFLLRGSCYTFYVLTRVNWERLFLILLHLNKRQHLLYLLTDHILWCNCHECQVSQCDKGNCFSKKCKKCLTKLFSFYEILFQHSKKESTKRKSVLSWTYLEFIDMQAVSGHNVALYYGVMYNKSWEKLKPM